VPDEWTGFDDIGRTFGGTVLTQAEYDRVEEAYVRTALQMLEANGVHSVVLRGVEDNAGFGSGKLTISDGHKIRVRDMVPYMRAILREHFWGRLEGDHAFVHFGWDYYMYVGVPEACPEFVVDEARGRGVFIEPFVSPYHPEEQEGEPVGPADAVPRRPKTVVGPQHS